MGEGGDGEVLRWIMSSVREEDGDGTEEEVRSELISGVQYQTKYDDQKMVYCLALRVLRISSSLLLRYSLEEGKGEGERW